MKRVSISAITAMIFSMFMLIVTFYVEIKEEYVYAMGIGVSAPMIIFYGTIITFMYDYIGERHSILMKFQARIPIIIGFGSIFSLLFLPVYFDVSGVAIWEDLKIVGWCMAYGALGMLCWLLIEKLYHYAPVKIQEWKGKIKAYRLQKKESGVEG